MSEFISEVQGRVRRAILVSGSVAFFFFASRRRHTRSLCDWSSDVCSSDLRLTLPAPRDGLELIGEAAAELRRAGIEVSDLGLRRPTLDDVFLQLTGSPPSEDRKSVV